MMKHVVCVAGFLSFVFGSAFAAGPGPSGLPAVIDGSTTVIGGANGQLLQNSSGLLGHLTLGNGVSTALGNATNSSGGLVTFLSGADPTGAQDSAPAFAAACAANPGSTIIVPAGIYLWNSAETFNQGCMFKGQGWNERNNDPNYTKLGTWIEVTSTSILPITFDANNGTNNDGGDYGFSDIAFEQSHPTPGTGWAPTVYQPLMTNTGQATLVLENLYFYNIYAVLNVPGTSGTTGRLRMDHIWGQPFLYLISGTEILDVYHVDDLHLWTFWSYDPNVVAWTEANGTPITLKRSDGFQSDHMFMLGYESCLTFGYESLSSPNGPTTNFHVGDLYCDLSKHAVTITGNNTTLDFGKITFQGTNLSGTLPGSEAILDSSSGSYVSIGNLVSQYSADTVIHLTNTAGGENYNIGNAYFINWDEDGSGAAAISILGASGASFVHFANAPLFISASPRVSLGTNGYVTNVWVPWTPTLYGSISAGTPTYGSQNAGEYIIIGNTITAKGFVVLNAMSGSPSGNAYIGGLPLVNNSTTSTFSPVSSTSGITLTGGFTYLTLGIGTASNIIQILQNGNGQSTTFAPIGDFTTCDLGFEITYRLF